jgi:hypothetical protein
MSTSREFPRKGIRRGPGGSGRLVDFTFDVQTDSKVKMDTAPMATMTVLSMKVNIIMMEDGFTAITLYVVRKSDVIMMETSNLQKHSFFGIYIIDCD